MATPATAFTDYGRGDFARHTRALDKRAHLASIRQTQGVPANAGAALADDFAYTTNAANRMLTRSRGVFKFRHFIDTLIGVAASKVGGRADWFEATDKELAEAAGRSKKWIQEMRRDFIIWQKKRGNYAFADIEDHKYTHGEATRPHRYRVHLSAAAAAAALDAYTSPDFENNPGDALRSAADTFAESLPQTATHRKHGRGRRDDAETEIHRSLRAATTSIKRADRMIDATGGHVEVELDTLAALKAAVEALEQKIAAQHGAVCASNTIKKKILAQTDEIETGGGVELSATPPPAKPDNSRPAPAPSVHSERDVAAWNSIAEPLGGKPLVLVPSPSPTTPDDGDAGAVTEVEAVAEARGAPVRTGRARYRHSGGEEIVTIIGEGAPYKDGGRAVTVAEIAGRVPFDEIEMME